MRILHLQDSELRADDARILPVRARDRNRRRLSVVGDDHVGVRQQGDAWIVHRRRFLDAGVRDSRQLDGDDGGLFGIQCGVEGGE